MPNVVFGNHLSVFVPQQEKENVRALYCGVLGGTLTKSEEDRDFIRLGDDFFIVFYGDVPDASEFLRSGRSVWLELKSDNVEETNRRILASGLVTKLDLPDPHLYFQAPGGQCLRVVGTDEDLSMYEGLGEAPTAVKERLKQGV